MLCVGWSAMRSEPKSRSGSTQKGSTEPLNLQPPCFMLLLPSSLSGGSIVTHEIQPRLYAHCLLAGRTKSIAPLFAFRELMMASARYSSNKRVTGEFTCGT